MDNDFPVLIDKDQLKARIESLAQEIDSDYQGEELTIICILKGSVIFTADLVRTLKTPTYLEFMIVSSYEDTESTGNVKIVKDLDCSIANKNILIVDDIVDTGRTLKYLIELLESRHPKSIEICTLLSKKAKRQCAVDVKYSGFDIGDEFVIGYGMDYNQKYRDLDCISIMTKKED